MLVSFHYMLLINFFKKFNVHDIFINSKKDRNQSKIIILLFIYPKVKKYVLLSLLFLINNDLEL